MGSLRVGHDWATSLTFHFHALEKEMATHSSILTWRIPGTEEPLGLPSMGLHRIGHDSSDLAAAAIIVKTFREKQEPEINKLFCLYKKFLKEGPIARSKPHPG